MTGCVNGQTSANKGGDPERVPVMTAHEWIKRHGAAGKIVASTPWGSRGRGKPPRPKSRQPKPVQLAIDEALAELGVDNAPIGDTPQPPAKVISDCETIGSSPVATTSEEDRS